MKRLILLVIVLGTIWLVWSGHFTIPFLLFLGMVSVAITIWVARRMQIVDDEGAPIGLGFRPVLFFLWLAKEIVKSNIDVARMILAREMPIHPRLVKIRALPKTPLGRVILANSITLTPGTVSIEMQGEQIWVHALSYDGAEEDLSGDMNQRIHELER